MMDDKDSIPEIPVKGSIVQRDDGFYIRLMVEGEALIAGPVATLDEARAIAKDAIRWAQGGYAELGIATKQRCVEKKIGSA